MPDFGRVAIGAIGWHAPGALSVLFGVLGCSPTVDSIGSDAPIDLGAKPRALGDLNCVEPPGNEFARALKVSDTVVKTRVETAFKQLFYGDPNTQAFYVPVGEDQAYVWDSVHEDVRTEGLGLAMNIAVKLDRHEEFDRLWRYSRSTQRVDEGAAAGYFESSCDTEDGGTELCLDPYGMQQFTMALVFAHHRWGSAGDIDYERDALELFELMRGKEEQNGGIVEGITDVFDDDERLPFHEPREEYAGISRPAAVMPGYYHLWASVTGLRFWRDAAQAGREYWRRAADSGTGLMPVRAEFDGTPVEGWDDFRPEGYRAQVNLALDLSWRSAESWEVELSDRIVEFFSARSDEGFCRIFTLDGTTCLDTEATPSLAIVNGLTAAASTVESRDQFIRALWELPLPTAYSRYYGGLLYLTAVMVVGGQFPVCDVD